jgi:murein DD-endopeptidase MepM/ murein hydrolase activator NlpD
MYPHSLHPISKDKTVHRIMIVILFGLLFLSSACDPGLTKEGDWAYPFPLIKSNACYKVATPFSVENPWDHAHEAVDFACLPDTPVYAVQVGVIERIEYTQVVGEARAQITLAIADTHLKVEYLNLKRADVQEGQTVAKGEQLGLSAIGLHVAVWDGERSIYVDPEKYLELPVPEEILE